MYLCPESHIRWHGCLTDVGARYAGAAAKRVPVGTKRFSWWFHEVLDGTGRAGFSKETQVSKQFCYVASATPWQLQAVAYRIQRGTSLQFIN